MSETITKTSFEENLRESIRNSIKKTIDEEISIATENIAMRLKGKAAQIVIEMATFVDVRRMNNEITVTFRDETKKNNQ